MGLTITLLKGAAKIAVVAAASTLSFIYWPGSNAFTSKDSKTGASCNLQYNGDEEAFALLLCLTISMIIHLFSVFLSGHVNQHSKYKFQFYFDAFCTSALSMTAVCFTVVMPLASQLLLPHSSWSSVVLMYSCHRFTEKFAVVSVVMSVANRLFRLFSHTDLDDWVNELIMVLVQLFLSGFVLHNSRLISMLILVASMFYSNVVQFWTVVRCCPLGAKQLRFTDVMLATCCWFRTSDLLLYGFLAAWVKSCPVLPEHDRMFLETSIGLLLIASILELKKNFPHMFPC